VPGFASTKGREENIAAYREHLGRIAAAAGQKAVAEWLSQNRGD
jgi:hypothetical protein